jgi:hypothetical protein
MDGEAKRWKTESHFDYCRCRPCISRLSLSLRFPYQVRMNILIRMVYNSFEDKIQVNIHARSHPHFHSQVNLDSLTLKIDLELLDQHYFPKITLF